jgi:hypothetical protein
MQSVEEFEKLLQKLGSDCSARDDLDEREVVTLFFEQGFFSILGYGKIGEDVRLETRIKRGRADVILRAFTSRPVCIIEFKRPGVNLAEHVNQLEEYVEELLPQYAALTNGNDFWLYTRQEKHFQEPPQKLRLAQITQQQAKELFELLRKREVDLERLDAVAKALEECREQPIRIGGPEYTGDQEFIQCFSLHERVAFGRLVRALFETLPSLMKRSDFTSGAYEFWRQVYSRELEFDETPSSWRPFLGKNSKKEELQRFMFALETAYALLARVMLAKAMQDAGFPHLDVIETFERALKGQQRQGVLRPTAYLQATLAIFEEGSRQAFESVFASDIFDWWADADKLEEPRFLCEAIAEAVLAVFQFDFSGLSGDLLGQLYQSYFDPETRKALGEFYTPPEVVEFILDQVGYQGTAVRTARLLDPACGSGTFLIHALRRYLQENARRDPSQVLNELIWGLRVVGFDINPFACLMAQVNYAAQLLPCYAQALARDPNFAIPLLPIFRTDSLRQEAKEGEAETVEEKARQKGFTLEFKGDVAYIKTELPVRVRKAPKARRQSTSPFLEIKIPVPRFDRALQNKLVANIEEYFHMLHATFTAVKAEDVTPGQLEHEFRKLKLSHPRQVAEYVAPAAKQLVQTMEDLRTEYGDGRFLKTIEDLALAMVLKNDLQYDFVVGNPPYVRIQKIPELSRKYWQGIYGWAEGNFDIFIPFIERAVVYWVKEGGKLGFICSNRFLLANYAAKLREQLTQLAEMELIFDLRDTRVFKDALNYPAILIVHRTESPQREAFVSARVFSDPGEGPKALLDEARVLIQRVSAREPYARGEHVDAFFEQREHLIPEGWYLMPPKERHVFRKLEEAATHRLHELTLTRSGGFAGYQTSADEIFVLKLLDDQGKRLRLQPKGGGEPVEIERQLLRPWLFGRDVKRWHIAWDGWYVLFPYVKIDGKHKLIPCEENAEIEPFKLYADKAPRMEDFPKAWAYFNKYKEKLQRREGGRFVHDWYGAARPQNLELYEQKKIVVQMSSQFPDMAYDEEAGFVFQAGGRGGGVYGIALDQSRIEPWFALALLNSSILDFFLKHVGTVYEGHTYSYSDAFIKDLPICLPKTKSQKKIAKRLAKLAQELTELKGKLRAKERERAAFPEPQIAKLEKQPELYPLSRLAQGEPQAAQIQVEDISLQRMLDSSWVLTFGRSTLVFPTEAHAKLAHIWLKLQGRSQVESAQLMGLRVPQSKQECQRLLELLEETEQEIERLQAQIKEGEAEVDELVAELYELSKTDQDVIREFLDRF